MGDLPFCPIRRERVHFLLEGITEGFLEEVALEPGLFHEGHLE